MSAPSSVALPTWTDVGSVLTYLTSVLGAVFAVVTALTGHGEPAVVQALLPSVGAVIAGVAQIVNVLSHRGVVKAAVLAGAAPVGK